MKIWVGLRDHVESSVPHSLNCPLTISKIALLYWDVEWLDIKYVEWRNRWLSTYVRTSTAGHAESDDDGGDEKEMN